MDRPGCARGIEIVTYIGSYYTQEVIIYIEIIITCMKPILGARKRRNH
jgi:hypothetical protein